MSRLLPAHSSLGVPIHRLEVDVEMVKRTLPPPPPSLPQPYFVLLCGLPGSGKTHFARLLAAQTPMQIIESDAARKALVAIPAYNSDENRRTFTACRLLAHELLAQGAPVLLDATNVTERDRNYSYAAAEREGAEIVTVKVIAPEGLIRRRLLRREQGRARDGASDAGWDVYLRMKAREEPIRRPHYLVDTSRDISADINKISNKLKSINAE